MQKFSLSTKNKALPETYVTEGSAFPIYTDFRRILRILRLLNDPEVLDVDRGILVQKLFFKGDLPQHPEKALIWFINCGEQREGGGDKDFDFEQDAREIYSGFMQVYGIDLLKEDMHYWRFSMLLDGLFASENALSNKVRLRHADDSKAKRSDDLARAKRNAAIGCVFSGADIALEKQIQQRIKEGKPIHDLIGGESDA